METTISVVSAFFVVVVCLLAYLLSSLFVTRCEICEANFFNDNVEGNQILCKWLWLRGENLHFHLWFSMLLANWNYFRLLWRFLFVANNLLVLVSLTALHGYFHARPVFWKFITFHLIKFVCLFSLFLSDQHMCSLCECSSLFFFLFYFNF